jgi:hypothetical protein
MKTLTYNILIYSDPGHAWGKVKRSMLHSLGVAHEISAWSYSRNDYVYLEEDADLPLFVNALERTGCKAIFKEKHSDKDSAIRLYDWYALETTA